MRYIRTLGSVVSIKEFRGMYFLALGFLVIQTVSNISLTGIQKYIINDVFLKGDYGLLPWTLFVFFVLFTCVCVMSSLAPQLMFRNEAKLHLKLSDRFVRHTYRTDYEWFQSQRIASVTQYFSNDIPEVSRLVTYEVPLAFQQVANACILIAIVGTSSLQLLLATVVLGVAYFFVGRKFGPQLKQSNKVIKDSLSEILVFLDEGISGAREIVGFDKMNWQSKRYHNKFNAYYEKVMQESRISNKQLFWTSPIYWGGQLIILGISGMLLLEHKMSVGTFVVEFQFASQLMSSCQDVMRAFFTLTSGLASAERLNTFLVSNESGGSGTDPISGMVQNLSLDNVTFRYKSSGKDILKSVTAHLPVGKKIAVVGPSGSGKSTLGKLLVSLHRPTSGAIWVNDANLFELKTDDWLNRIRMVPQEPYMFPASIRHNISMGNEPLSDEELINACILADIHEFITTLPEGYDTVIGERGLTLSGGQRQRLALARAVADAPEVLLLDEATSALDVDTEARIMRRLAQVRSGKTTIVIAHRLSTIRDAEVILVMDDGVIREIGTHEELMGGNSLYRQLYEA